MLSGVAPLTPESPVMHLKPLSSLAPAGKELMLRSLAVIVLVGGLGMATSIWLAEDEIDRQTRIQQTNDLEATEALGPLSPEDSRRYTRDVKVYYGETGLLLDKWSRTSEELTHGKGLAKTIALASVLATVGLFWFAAVFYPKPLTAGGESRT